MGPHHRHPARFSIIQFHHSIAQFTDYRINRFALVVALLACGCSVGAGGPLTISVVGTNDLHGGVLSQDDRGGLALLDGYVGNLRAARERDGGAVVLLDAGDLFQGTLESNLNEGAVVISGYNALRYDAAAIGNHEFDFGPAGPATSPQSPSDDPHGALKARIKEARFPFLAANIIDKNTTRPIAWDNVKPSTILTVAGVRVGVVGVTTLDTLSATLSANMRDIDVVALAPTLEREARRLRSEGATIVLAVAHAGGRCAKFDDPSDLSSCQADAEIFKVARALPAGLVDAIVAGHRHEGIAHEVAGIPVISAYSSGRAFGRIDLQVDRRTGHVTGHHLFRPHDICGRDAEAAGRCASLTESGAPAQYEGRPVIASREIEAILAPAVEAARSLKEEPLGAVIADPMRRSDDGESAVGNLLADWMRASSGTDLAIANVGGLRAGLPPGPLSYGRLFELTPFDNLEALLTLTGEQVAAVVRNDLEHHRRGLILSGARATATCGVGGLHVMLRRDSGTAIGDREMLKVVTSDFLATGGDDLLTHVMPPGTGASTDGTNIRDAIAAWLRRSGGTWRSSDEFDPSHRRIAFEGTRPVRCDGAH